MYCLHMTDLDLSHKRVLMREDLNVPIRDGAITSDARIRAAVPSIQQVLEQPGASVLLMSHLGRPTEGQFESQFSLAPVAERLTELLHPAQQQGWRGWPSRRGRRITRRNT